MICLYFVRGEFPTLGIYNTDTSREIDRVSRDKLSMPPGMKGILCTKFDLFKIKNTDFWAAYAFPRVFLHVYDIYRLALLSCSFCNLLFDFFFIMISLFYLNIGNISEDISLLNFVYSEKYIFKMTVKFLT